MNGDWWEDFRWLIHIKSPDIIQYSWSQVSLARIVRTLALEFDLDRDKLRVNMNLDVAYPWISCSELK